MISLKSRLSDVTFPILLTSPSGLRTLNSTTSPTFTSIYFRSVGRLGLAEATVVGFAGWADGVGLEVLGTVGVLVDGVVDGLAGIACWSAGFFS